MGPNWIAERVGISLELTFRCLARINRTHKMVAPRSGGEQGAYNAERDTYTADRTV
jgi:hypothetical protein